jgi:hypothetical protein
VIPCACKASLRGAGDAASHQPWGFSIASPSARNGGCGRVQLPFHLKKLPLQIRVSLAIG